MSPQTTPYFDRLPVPSPRERAIEFIENCLVLARKYRKKARGGADKEYSWRPMNRLRCMYRDISKMRDCDSRLWVGQARDLVLSVACNSTCTEAETTNAFLEADWILQHWIELSGIT